MNTKGNKIILMTSQSRIKTWHHDSRTEWRTGFTGEIMSSLQLVVMEINITMWFVLQVPSLVHLKSTYRVNFETARKLEQERWRKHWSDRRLFQNVLWTQTSVAFPRPSYEDYSDWLLHFCTRHSRKNENVNVTHTNKHSWGQTFTSSHHGHEGHGHIALLVISELFFFFRVRMTVQHKSVIERRIWCTR